MSELDEATDDAAVAHRQRVTQYSLNTLDCVGTFFGAAHPRQYILLNHNPALVIEFIEFAQDSRKIDSSPEAEFHEYDVRNCDGFVLMKLSCVIIM